MCSNLVYAEIGNVWYLDRRRNLQFELDLVQSHRFSIVTIQVSRYDTTIEILELYLPDKTNNAFFMLLMDVDLHFLKAIPIKKNDELDLKEFKQIWWN